MSANRKLQSAYNPLLYFLLFSHAIILALTLAEIVQVLKKVEEGVILFEDIWEKVSSVTIQSTQINAWLYSFRFFNNY